MQDPELPRQPAAARALPGGFIRSLAGIYLLVLVFEDTFSELRVEGVVKRARGHLEELLAALPPEDPPPKGGRLLPMREP